MGQRTSYTPGTLRWAALPTADQDAAKRFYGELLGGAFDDLPIGPDAVYSMAHIAGARVAAISPQPDQQRDAGAPPLWNSYVTVARARSLGGSVHAPAFDVMEAGRMAVVQDPQGAYFMAWEAKENIGADLVNAPGALVWNELTTPDLDASEDFYGSLFGWNNEVA